MRESRVILLVILMAFCLMKSCQAHNATLPFIQSKEPKICQDYLDAFLNGTTDVRDECEGMLSAYQAAGCRDVHDPTTNQRSLTKGRYAIQKQRRQESMQYLKRLVNIHIKPKENQYLSGNPQRKLEPYPQAWHCCNFLHNYYSTHCASYEQSQHSPITDWNALSILSILVVCGMVRGIVRKSHCKWLPEAGACILVGVFFGGVYTAWTMRSSPPKPNNRHKPISSSVSSNWETSTYYDNLFFDDDVFLRILLPPIVFAAAVTINKKAFKKLLAPILIYAIGGTILSSFLTGWMVHSFSSVNANSDELTTSASHISLPKLESYIFGALISSVDPVAILSVLQSIGMTDTDALYVVIFGESLLNDGVSIVLFDVLAEYLEDTQYTTGDQALPRDIMNHVFWNFCLVALSSLAIGFGCAALASVYYWALEGYQHAAVEVALFFCWALIPYYISDGAGFSGIVALVAAGFLMDVFIVGGTGILGIPFEMSFTSRTIQAQQVNVSRLDDSEWPSPSHYYAHDDNDATSSEGISIVQWHQQWNRRMGIFSNAGHLSTEARVNVKFVSEVLANLAETAIFAYLGFFLFGSNNAWNIGLISTAIVSVMLSRAIMIVGFGLVMAVVVMMRRNCCRSDCWSKLWLTDVGSLAATSLDAGRARPRSSWLEDIVNVRTQIILIIAGIRGAVSFALVENIPLYNVVTETGSRYKGELKAMTSIVILFTVFVCGGCTYGVFERLSGRNARRSTARSSHGNDLMLSRSGEESDADAMEESLLHGNS